MPILPIFVVFRHFKICSVRHYTKSIKPNLHDLLTNSKIKMPKEPKHVAEKQIQRKKIKEKQSKYAPGRVTLQVLGTGAKGAPGSLYVFSDQSRYLFNCGEGTQRLAHELKLKLAKLEHIFITQPVWKNLGGLPGTSLTIQDVGVPQITLHGPDGLQEMFVACKRFVVLKDLRIKMAKCEEDVLFEDNVLKVNYVILTRENKSMEVDNAKGAVESNLEDRGEQCSADMMDGSTSTRSENPKKQRRSRSKARSQSADLGPIIEDDTDYYAHESSGTRTAPEQISVLSQLKLEEIKEKGIVMSYICQLQPRPGALLLDKCVHRGVPAGPLLGKLKAGEDVTLKDGTVVRSTDVCEPDDPGPIFIVIDCPSEEYVDSLVKSTAFGKHQKFSTRDEDIATVVVHFTPKNVMDDPRYKSWMENFVPSTNHLVLNETNTCMGSESVHRIQYKLNLLNKDIFPLLKDCGTKILENGGVDIPLSKRCKIDDTSPEKTEKESINGSQNVSESDSSISANTLCSVHLRPKKGLDRSEELTLVPNEYIQDTMNVENFPTILQDLHQKTKLVKDNLTIRDFPRLLFLGTGSCIPNKTRNTSAILLETQQNKSILVDCGEGTYGQIVRFYGKDECETVLASINAVYISHLHADHHIGLVGLLQGRKRALQNLKIPHTPVHLFAPYQILSWLSFYDKCFENILTEFTLIPNSDLLSNDFKLAPKLMEQINQKVGLSDIKTCFVRHCPNAFGVSFYLEDSKITYSGDSMPSDNLVQLGIDSDLLIHEATMEDDLAHEAVIKMHSTTSQAIEIGRKMCAKSILLTHFSQRYAKLPRFNENLNDVGIAFDNMQVRLDELPLIPYLYPALKLMFAEHHEELEHKAVKRQLRMEREREASQERQKLKLESKS